MSVAIGMWKFCPHCKQHKEANLENFGRDKSRADSLHPHCKPCRRTYRLLRKPVPEVTLRVATCHPQRTSIPMEKWEIFDSLVAAGVPVTIIKADGEAVDWGALV